MHKVSVRTCEAKALYVASWGVKYIHIASTGLPVTTSWLDSADRRRPQPTLL